MSKELPHVPVLRFGREYESLEVNEVAGYQDGEIRARVSQVNAGIIRRDMKKIAEKAAKLREIPVAELLEISKKAGELFMHGTLPINSTGDEQSPEDYVAALASTSGLPYIHCRRNMQKIFTVMDGMAGILRGLMRGLPLSVLDEGICELDGLPICYATATDSLGVVLPSNSPGVNSIWIPSLVMKVPVLLKPGREEPWTPLRILRAYEAAGLPSESFGFYPTDHEGAATILEVCGRAQLFGDEKTTGKYASNPGIEIHGPGRSKVILGPDVADDWEQYVDLLAESVGQNGGRSCINASAILVPSHGDEIADAMARRLTEMRPQPASDETATLAAFANPKMVPWIDGTIENGLKEGGEDVSARYREGERAQKVHGGDFMLPTIVRCPSMDHPLANTEFMFPFASVVEVPTEKLLDVMGPTLVATVITRDESLRERFVRSTLVDRLNLGPIPTTKVEWDQPHEGNLFEMLYERRAIQRVTDW